jgi:hypothetical protein
VLRRPAKHAPERGAVLEVSSAAKGVERETLISSTHCFYQKRERKNMKKMYVSPRLEAASGEATEMLAASLPIGEGTVDGSDALVKENDWDIFCDEDAVAE